MKQPKVESTLLTFGYGSNMCLGRMQRRVPSLGFVAVAELRGYRFVFNKVSKDGSAKGNVVLSNQDDRTHGVVFSFDSAEERSLNRAEGLGDGYGIVLLTVHALTTGEPYQVRVYVAEIGYTADNLWPYSWYKRQVVEGALHYKLPIDYVARLAAMPAAQDPDRARDAAERAYACSRLITDAEADKLAQLRREHGRLTDYAPRFRQLKHEAACDT